MRLLRSLHSPTRFARGFDSPQRHCDTVSKAELIDFKQLEKPWPPAFETVTTFDESINLVNLTNL